MMRDRDISLVLFHTPDGGFTLVEVLVAVVIFGIVAAIPLGFLNQARYTGRSGERLGAIAAAQRKFDSLRIQDISALPESGSETETTTIGANTFSVITEYCGDTTYCTSNNNRHIRIEVYGSGTRLFHAETVYSQLR